MKKKEIIGIIPARFESSRFPGKPLATINGISLIQRTYENARQAECLSHLVVATDDQRIFDHVKSFGGEVVMTSVDCATGTDRLAEGLKLNPNWLQADAIVNIQGDEPCLPFQTINLIVESLLADPIAQMSTAVTQLITESEAFHPSIVKCTKDLFGNALYFSRSLIPSNKRGNFDPKQLYWRHLGIYAYRPEFLSIYAKLPQTPLQIAEDLEQLKAIEHGYRIKIAIVESSGIGVDHPEDINKVELWINKQNSSLLPAESAPRSVKD
jgi:3-deoxy-manno-octulosonate cytidylyltransferase (CMP-KDO synthetase)